MYTVYKHTNLINDKVYIGITKQQPEKRWNNGYGYRTCRIMYNAILKYGWLNFKHEILFEGLTYEEACEKEILLIALYKSNQREFGYNIESGGNLQKEISEETRQKLSYKASHISEETRQKIGNTFRGKKHSLETKIKIGSKKVLQYSLDGKLLAEYYSVREAARQLNIAHNNIVSCCLNRYGSKTAGGFKWRYSE